MSKNSESQSNEMPLKSASPRRGLAIAAVFAGVLLLWIVTPFVMRWLFSTWEERGVVGDSFGAVNALFSGLAFAGVVVALWLQREQMKIQSHEFQLNLSALTDQIREMQKAREMQSQPLLIVSLPENIMFARPQPRIAASGSGSGAISTFPVQLKFYNASSDPALNIKVRASLQGVGSAPEQKIDMLPLPIMPQEKADRDMKFTVTHEAIFNSHESMIDLGEGSVNVSGHDANCMKLKFEIYFQNTTGAYFLSQQTYALAVKEGEDVEALRQWIAEWRSPDSVAPGAEPLVHSIRLAGHSIPGTFSYKPINQEEYSAVA
jgi:hypothetical protein